jgi:hypothetical protein
MKRSFPTDVTKTSATLRDICPADWDSGGVREEANGRRYRVFQNTTSIAGGETSNGIIATARVLEASTYTTATGIIGAIYYTTVTKDCIGATVTSIPFAHYFWAQIGGLCSIKGTTTIDLPVAGSATDGSIADAAATDTGNAVGTSLATTSAAAGAVLLTIA